MFGRNNGQEGQGRDQQGDVQNHLGAVRKQPGDQMRVGIARQEADLKEQHASGPDAGSSAKPGQNKFPDQRLDLKEKEGAEKNRERKKAGTRGAADFPGTGGLLSQGEFLARPRYGVYKQATLTGFVLRAAREYRGSIAYGANHLFEGFWSV